MTVKNNQLETPFLTADKNKLDGIETGAKSYEIALQNEAENGVDNVKLMTPLRVAQAIAAQAGGGGGGTYVSGEFANNSGGTITAIALVKQNSASEIDYVDPSVEDDVVNILGLLIDTTANGASGTVVLGGLIQNVTTPASVGDTLYLAKDSSISVDAPDIGVNSFVAGDFVVRIGQIVKNSSNPLQKDLKVDLQLIGQL